MNQVHAEGFPPVCDGESALLILGSFPSVKSREVGFYYGNRQNRFWKTVCGFFGEEVPPDTQGKKEFLFRRRIALWDVIVECDIVGSSDASIENEAVADIGGLVRNSKIGAILCNGAKSFELFSCFFPEYLGMAKRLSSTSPANPRFSEREWREALGEALGVPENR